MPSQAAVDLLAALVAFDTTSDRSNLPLIHFVRDYLARFGVASRVIADESGEKANLFATLGPAERPGVMLSGHTDTVPVRGQHWRVDPYRLTREPGRLYGRGTADMKGFIAAVLAAVPAMVKAELAAPIHLAFSHDEEVGCLGVRHLIDFLRDAPIRPAACIVGEPTSMRLATAHKGKLAGRLTVTGRACHSGMAPQGVNAIYAAARLVAWFEDKARAKALDGPFDDAFDIPYSTVHVGTIQGGNALNIVPDRCWLDFEFRNVPGDDNEALLAELRAYAASLEAELQRQAPEAGIAVERLSDYPGLATGEDAAVVDFIQALLDDQTRERINFGTEGGLFQRDLKVPTLVCGPGSMAQGHKADEYVTVEQLGRCEAFLARLIERLADPRVIPRLAAWAGADAGPPLPAS